MHKDNLEIRYNHIDNNSYFVIELATGETINEIDYSFRSFSTEKLVLYRGSNKVVKLCDLPAVSMTMKHYNLEHTMEIPANCQVYQAIVSVSQLLGTETVTKIVGRIMGLVKDGEVIQELYLDGLLGEISGFKK